MDEVKVSIKGTFPLMMCNERLANPLDPFTKARAALTGKKGASTKTDEHHLAIGRLEFEGGLYYDDEIGPYVPVNWLYGVIRSVSWTAIHVSKAEITGAISFTESKFPLQYDGPRTPDAMWGDGFTKFVDQRTIVNSGPSKGRTLRFRPIFEDWSLPDFVMLYNPKILDPEKLQTLWEAASMRGLGDYRPIYGRFEVSLG